MTEFHIIRFLTQKIILFYPRLLFRGLFRTKGEIIHDGYALRNFTHAVEMHSCLSFTLKAELKAKLCH
jgi:hypothetical protein